MTDIVKLLRTKTWPDGIAGDAETIIMGRACRKIDVIADALAILIEDKYPKDSPERQSNVIL